MRNRIVFAVLIVLSSPALAQQPALTVDPAAPPPPSGVPIAGAAPAVGTPENPGTTVGRATPADDGISTRTVKAVPCGTAAHETDGSTTCIGIPAHAWPHR